MVSNETQHASSKTEAHAFALLRPLFIHADFDTAATEFLGRLCVFTGCERATLGLSVDGMVKLCAASEPLGSHGCLQQWADAGIAAMEESLMQDAVLVYPPSDNAFPYVLVAHAELARCRNAATVQTFPLSHQDRQIGAITLERCSAQACDEARLASLDMLRFDLGSHLQQKWLQSQPWWVRCRSSMRQKIWHGAATPYRTIVKGSLLTICVIAGTIAPLPDTVTGEARLEAATQRVITTPVDGFLKEVRVRPGDRVSANQLLAELNDDSLRIQQRQIHAELRQQENALAEAMVKGERTQIAIRRARLDELQAEKDLLEQHLSRTRLVAPFDGVIIKGDLSHLLGSPLKRGDMILTLSHGPEFRIIIDVPESEIGDIRLGQRGMLTLLALPTQRKPFHITRINPVATINTDGRNVFEVEAALDESEPALAPGMRGAAKISMDSSASAWQRIVKLWHALSYTIWSKLG